mgnify:FL=1
MVALRFRHKLFNFIVEQTIRITTVGISLSWPQHVFDPFYFNTQAINIIIMTLYMTVIIAMLIGSRMAEGRPKYSLNYLWFFAIYSVIAPLWLLKAVYNTIFAKKTAWR